MFSLMIAQKWIIRSVKYCRRFGVLKRKTEIRWTTCNNNMLHRKTEGLCCAYSLYVIEYQARLRRLMTYLRYGKDSADTLQPNQGNNQGNFYIFLTFQIDEILGYRIDLNFCIKQWKISNYKSRKIQFASIRWRAGWWGRGVI